MYLLGIRWRRVQLPTMGLSREEGHPEQINSLHGREDYRRLGNGEEANILRVDRQRSAGWNKDPSGRKTDASQRTDNRADSGKEPNRPKENRTWTRIGFGWRADWRRSITIFCQIYRIPHYKVLQSREWATNLPLLCPFTEHMRSISGSISWLGQFFHVSTSTHSVDSWCSQGTVNLKTINILHDSKTNLPNLGSGSVHFFKPVGLQPELEHGRLKVIWCIIT